MHRTLALGAGAVFLLGIGAPGVAAAQGLASSEVSGTVVVSGQDQLFVTQNGQTNLTEISGGMLAAQRLTNGALRSTSATILADHERVLARLRQVGSETGATLPSQPNSTQLAMAAQLKRSYGATFNSGYLQGEIKGHELSIAHTQQEIRSGSSPTVRAFASFYLPIAQKHLRLLEQDAGVSSTVTPTSVNAGSGGQAASSAGTSAAAIGLATAGGLLVAGSAGVLVRRRRTQ